MNPKIGIVDVGGGYRSVYAAGVMDRCMRSLTEGRQFRVNCRLFLVIPAIWGRWRYCAPAL